MDKTKTGPWLLLVRHQMDGAPDYAEAFACDSEAEADLYLRLARGSLGARFDDCEVVSLPMAEAFRRLTTEPTP